MDSADIYITKLAAAQRQLRAAIRMFFQGEDELAIHTVASASYSILVDLKSQRGGDEVGDFYGHVITNIVREYRLDLLSESIMSNAGLMKWISELSRRFPLDLTEVNNASINVGSKVEKDFWKKRNKAANFLKHADRDAEEHISQDEIDNSMLLMLGINAYGDVADIDDLKAEGMVLIFYGSTDLTYHNLAPEHLEMVRALKAFEGADRLAASLRLVEILNDEYFD